MCWTVFFPRGNIRQWVDVWILAVAQAEGLVMPTNKNMKTTYQDKQTWHGIFSLKFARGGPTWCILFGIMRESCQCWISPEAFSAFKACREVMGGRREVMGGMDDVIASNLDQCFSPFLWLIPPKKIFKIERPWERNLMFFLGEWNFLLRNLDHESLRELSIYMKLKLKEIRWCSDKWKVHSI